MRVAVGNLPVRGMVSTQSAAIGGGRKLVPSLQQPQQQLAKVSSHVDQPSNLAELLLGIAFASTYPRTRIYSFCEADDTFMRIVANSHRVLCSFLEDRVHSGYYCLRSKKTQKPADLINKSFS